MSSNHSYHCTHTQTFLIRKQVCGSIELLSSSTKDTRFDNVGVYYGATQMEARFCRGRKLLLSVAEIGLARQ